MFFIAVKIQASDAMSRAERTIELRERYRGMAATMETRDGVALVDPVCENPLVTTRSWRRGSA